MKSRLSVIALAAALVLTVAAASARAETETPSPSPSAPAGVSAGASPSTSVDPFVVPFDGAVLDITFPEADIEGSVTEDGAVITLTADVFFAYNKATLNAKASAALDRAAQRLSKLGASRVRVAGFTDNKGSASYNRQLSLRRAEAVRKGIADRLPGLAFEVRGYGESRPVATNKTANGRALNRRVTITVVG